jgi:hypothetical protein
MKRMQSSVNFQTDVAIHNALRKAAEAEGRTVSNLVRMIVKNWCDDRVPQQQRRREKRQPESSAA